MLRNKSLKFVLPTVLLLILFIGFVSVGVGGASSFAYAKDNTDVVYLGGMPIGISAISENLIVSEIVNVVSNDGSYSPAYQSGVLKGDMILSVNGVEVRDLASFNEAVGNDGKAISIKVQRNADTLSFVVQPVMDLTQNSFKIGLLLKNELSGIGTMTFITKNNKYGALGHMIFDEYGYGGVYSSGYIYGCNITGYNVATEKQPGELRGTIDYVEHAGTICENAFCGLYGEFNFDKSNLQTIEVGHRNEVKNGKAHIYTTIEGNTPKLYEIEIIKAVSQDEPAEKGMVIRITDKELKKKTGGILQGMSGSPIIQNGKLIGAVTHVFTTDSTKGYGIYVDWMLNKV